MPGQEDHEESRKPPWASGIEGEQLSFGTWLRRQREIREIPLREIAEVTKISMRYLEALEQDRFDVLPAPVFQKGFLREYSRYVGLDPDEVVNSFLTAQEAPAEGAEESVEKPKRSAEWASGLALAAGVIGLLALVSFLIFFGGRERQRTAAEPPPIAVPPVPEPETPVPVVEPEPEPAEVVPIVVTMDFTEDCWVEATVDGESRLSELHVQGESITLQAQEGVQLTLGNPTGVRIEINGREYDPGFQPGRVARDLLIDLATVEELRRQAVE